MFKSKKSRVLAVMAVVFMVVIAATPSTLKRQVWNAVQFFKHGIYVGTTNQFQVDSVGNIDTSGGLDVSDGNFVVDKTTGNITAAGGETPERSVDISIWDLAVENTEIGRLYATKPGYVYDAQSPALVWLDDTYTSPALKTLKVPENYLSGIGYRLFISETGGESNGGYEAPNSSPGYVDYTVYVHSDGNLVDATGYPQTAVRLDFPTGVLHELDLPVTFLSDTAVLSASDTWVTLDFGRSIDSINAQWVHGAQMYYTPEY
ncbi:hypothetical protein LCGC14_3007310 [marine sediment metagenome]|uniref:Uncharacterized protein n=1 Tax=marine sediment metagenome TaxID=412755 RepID=A0A0F8XM04_9ZZZZ